MIQMDQLFQSCVTIKQNDMNKAPNRYDRTDHISRIQANLREMKQEVSEYLRKSNNQAVPPVLRARHYLILSCINKLNNNSNDNQRENIKVLKDLSSQKLGNAIDSDRFQPLRQNSIEKTEKNKIVKQKRTLLRFQNRSNVGEADCLLPNICQIKLDFQDKAVKMPRRSMLEGKIIDTNIQENQYNQIMKERRYHSIDLSREVHMQDNTENVHQTNGFKVTNRWLSPSKSRQLINKTQKKHSLSNIISQQQLIKQKDSITAAQVVDFSKQKPILNQLQTLSPKIVYQQRKQAILKRRAEAVLNFSKSKSKKGFMGKKSQNNEIKKTFNFRKKSINSKVTNKINNQCSPWQESDVFPQRQLLQGQFF